MSGAGWFFLLLLLIVVIYLVRMTLVYLHLKRNHEPIPYKEWQFYVPFMTSSTTSSNYPSPRSAGPFEYIKDKFAQLRNRRTTSAGAGYEGTRSGASGLAGSGGGAGTYDNVSDPSSALNSAGRRGRGLEDDAWDTRLNSADDPYGDHHETEYNPNASGLGGGYGYGNARGADAELGLNLAPTPGYAITPGLQAAYNSGAGDYISRVEGTRGATDSNPASERGRSALRTAAAASAGNAGPDVNPGAAANDPFGDRHETGAGPGLRGISPRPYVAEINTGVKHTKTNNSLGGESASSASTRKSVFHEGI